MADQGNVNKANDADELLLKVGVIEVKVREISRTLTSIEGILRYVRDNL